MFIVTTEVINGTSSQHRVRETGDHAPVLVGIKPFVGRDQALCLVGIMPFVVWGKHAPGENMPLL